MGAGQLRRGALAALGLLAAVGLSACGQQEPNLIAGKQLFVERCGACHVLERAGTKGTAGPDLDAAFRRAIIDGLGRDAIRGAVSEQILHPGDFSRESGAYMPADLVTGEDVDNVAAYVARSVARPGEDEGLLAEAVKEAGGGEPAVAENGILSIPAAPSGQLAYVTDRARAEPGELTIRSPNESSVPHNIALDQPDEVGEVVQDGGVSEIKVTLDPGEYTFYCSVEGHREAGMEGTLTVER